MANPGNTLAFQTDHTRRIAMTLAQIERDPTAAKRLFRTRAQIKADERRDTATATSRLDALAELVSQAELFSQEVPVMAAGAQLGMTKGETASAWRAIKRDLGAQAA